jgi:hypothetical protein
MKQVTRVNGRVGQINPNGGEDFFVPDARDAVAGGSLHPKRESAKT